MGLNAAARSDSATEKLLATDAGREPPADVAGRTPDRDTGGARATDGGREVRGTENEDWRGSDAVDGPRAGEGLYGVLPLTGGRAFLFVGGERLTLGERRLMLGERRLTAGARAGEGFLDMILA